MSDRSLGNDRVYRVRPPRLAEVLVAERLFGVTFPAVSVDGLLAVWPDRLSAASKAVVAAALLGSVNAKRVAGQYFDQAIGSSDVEPTEKVELAEK